jgi:hypothetical protein
MVEIYETKQNVEVLLRASTILLIPSKKSKPRKIGAGITSKPGILS